MVEQQTFDLMVMSSTLIILIIRKINHIILDFEKYNNFNITNYWIFIFLQKNNNKFNEYSILIKPFYKKPQNSLFNYININFLRKEYLYTKLKYSRSPAYDIVSGGVAAIFAGFLGFLVSEKFGLELVDSGDFYFIIMYIIFISFIIKSILTISIPEKSIFNVLNFKYIWRFYIILSMLFLSSIN